MTVLTIVARFLELDRSMPGERTAWTVRTAHGVHSVELDQTVIGTRVRVDGRVVGRAPAWSFSDEPFRFPIGASRGIVAVRADAGRGSLRASLLVDGEPVPQDPPERSKRAEGRIPWRRILERAGYALAALLVVSAAIGDPVRDWTSTALVTTVNVAWLAAVRGIDPFALLPGWMTAVSGSRAGMLLAGLELFALVTLTRDERIRRRIPLLGSRSRAWRVVGWAVLVLAAAVPPTLLDA